MARVISAATTRRKYWRWTAWATVIVLSTVVASPASAGRPLTTEDTGTLSTRRIRLVWGIRRRSGTARRSTSGSVALSVVGLVLAVGVRWIVAPVKVQSETERLSRPVALGVRLSHLAGRVRLAFTDCLGPCSEANVILLYLHGRPLWFRRVNSPELFAALVEYARAAIDNAACALPVRLGPHAFSWTGGGVSPEPPVQDVDTRAAAAERSR